MSGPASPSPTVERLVRYLLDGGEDDPLAGELLAWLAGSARFRTFADTNRDKIRKKLRGASDADARRDVRAELRVAERLLADRRVGLAFEAYGSGRPGPDFTVTLGGDRFNLEVTRLRGDPAAAGFGGLLAKLRQLPPSVANGVVLAIDGLDANAYDAAAAVGTLRAWAEAMDDALFIARGFAGARAFRDRLARLGAAFVFAELATGELRATAWTNPEARIAFPGRSLRACLACLRAGD
ncbi:MAG: hypothetical protein ABI577_10980 [bacterium]